MNANREKFRGSLPLNARTMTSIFFMNPPIQRDECETIKLSARVISRTKTSAVVFPSPFDFIYTKENGAPKNFSTINLVSAIKSCESNAYLADNHEIIDRRLLDDYNVEKKKNLFTQFLKILFYIMQVI